MSKAIRIRVYNSRASFQTRTLGNASGKSGCITIQNRERGFFNVAT